MAGPVPGEAPSWEELRLAKSIPAVMNNGATLENIGEVRAAGAEVIVAGTAIFGAPDPARAVRALRGV